MSKRPTPNPERRHRGPRAPCTTVRGAIIHLPLPPPPRFAAHDPVILPCPHTEFQRAGDKRSDPASIRLGSRRPLTTTSTLSSRSSLAPHR